MTAETDWDLLNQIQELMHYTDELHESKAWIIGAWVQSHLAELHPDEVTHTISNPLAELEPNRLGEFYPFGEFSWDDPVDWVDCASDFDGVKVKDGAITWEYVSSTLGVLFDGYISYSASSLQTTFDFLPFGGYLYGPRTLAQYDRALDKVIRLQAELWS